jgi:hypothetical protein
MTLNFRDFKDRAIIVHHGSAGGGGSPKGIPDLAMMLDINDINTETIDGWNGAGVYATYINDQSGNGYHHRCGTNNQNPLVDLSENALYFNATHSTFAARLREDGIWGVPAADGSEFTICMVVKAADYVSKYLYCQFLAVTDFFYIRPSVSHRMQFISEAGDSRLINLIAYDSIPLNEWVLLTIRVKRTVSAEGFYNTTETDVTETANSSGSQTFSGGSSSLFCRDSANGWTTGYFRALLIYDRALTTNEIASIYNYYI